MSPTTGFFPALLTMRITLIWLWNTSLKRNQNTLFPYFVEGESASVTI